MKKIMVFILACMMISACSVSSNEKQVEELETIPALEESENIEKVEEIPVFEDIAVEDVKKEDVIIKPVEVTIKTLENSYAGSDGIVVSHVKIEYPIIQNDLGSEEIDKINIFFQDTAIALYEENNTYAIDNAQSVKEDTTEQVAENTFLSEYSVVFEVKYNANGILSILQNFSEKYYGQEESNAYATGYVFDLETGERLSINDILSGTNQEIAQIIGQAFLESDKIEDRIKNYYQDELLSNTQYAEFYIDDKNIVFFYNPNMVIPYNEGTTKTYIPFNTQGLLKMKMKVKIEGTDKN